MLSLPHIQALLIVLSLSCVLTACFHTPTLPKWVTHKVQSDDVYYAVGQGVNLHDAEMNARASLAAELSSTVSDLTKIYSFSDGKFQQQIYEQYTSVEVSEIKLSNARITRQEDGGNRYFVQLELSKENLATQLESELSLLSRSVALAIRANEAETFEQWWKLRSALPEVKGLARNLNLLKQINTQPYTRESALVTRYFNKLDTSYGLRELDIENLSKTKNLEALVNKALQDENISLAESSFWSKKDYIELSREYSRQQIGQEYYVDGTLWLRLKSAKGQLLSEFSLKARGVSYSGPRQSKAIADQKLYDKLNNTSIFDSLLEAKQPG